MTRRKFKRKICPKCGSTSISTYVPGFIEPQEKRDPYIIYTGCVIKPNMPKYHCNGCNTDYYDDMTEWQEKPKSDLPEVSYFEELPEETSGTFQNKLESFITIAFIVICLYIFLKYGLHWWE